MYEHRRHPVLARRRFFVRMLKHGLSAFMLMLASLMIGVVGYHYICRMGWIDSILNASMILGGMGPVNPIETNAGKLFAAFYALFAGVVFLVVVGIMLAPMAHRILHYLHLEDDEITIRQRSLDELASKD
jgi:hypothetical protein